MIRRRLLFLVPFLLLCGSPSWAQTDTPAVVLKGSATPGGGAVDVSLHAADAATIARVVGEALGATVRIEGATAAPVTISLPHSSAHAVLDALAASLHAAWRPIYAVAAGPMKQDGRKPVPLGRMVSAHLDQVGARTALSMITRAAAGSLELRAELTQSVNLDAKAMPVEDALDAIARQIGAVWSVSYVFQAGATPTRSEVLAPPPDAPRTPRSTGRQPQAPPTPPGFSSNGGAQGILTDPRSFPMPFADDPRSTPAPSRPDPKAAQMLGEGLGRMMQMPPVQRRAAVKDLATQLEQQFRQMQSLPVARRNEQMAAMRPLYKAATQTFAGLPPDARRDFEPLVNVFSRWIR